MRYKIAKLLEENGSTELEEVDQATVIGKYDNMMLSEYLDFLKNTEYKITVSDGDVSVTATEQTRKQLEDRSIIVSFWEDFIKYEICIAVDNKQQIIFFDENKEYEYILFNETYNPEELFIAPAGTAVGFAGAGACIFAAPSTDNDKKDNKSNA